MPQQKNFRIPLLEIIPENQKAPPWPFDRLETLDNCTFSCHFFARRGVIILGNKN